MIRLIAALDTKRGIARSGALPWHLPSDLRYFRELTTKFGGVVLMGHTTYNIIGHPLKDRHNFVLSYDPRLVIPGTGVVQYLDQFLGEHADIWVIGGASVFEQTLDWADELYLTQIDADFGADQLFPVYESAFMLLNQSDWHEENNVRFAYTIFGKQ